MLKQISMRIPKEMYDTAVKLSRLEKQEKSFILREAIKKGLNKIKIEVAIELYKEKRLSISGAAQLAEIGVGDMMDLLIKNGVKSELTIEELKEDFKIAEKII
jgi:predicted HTH domain antitoxin